MSAFGTRYEGCVLMRGASGTGPYFGQYRFARDGADGEVVPWIALTKSWSTKWLACDDAFRAAHFAIDAQNHCDAADRAVEAAARVMTLDIDIDAPEWTDAVRAQLVAVTERDLLEAKLVGAKEGHWPDIQLQAAVSEPVRYRRW